MGIFSGLKEVEKEFVGVHAPFNDGHFKGYEIIARVIFSVDTWEPVKVVGSNGTVGTLHKNEAGQYYILKVKQWDSF